MLKKTFLTLFTGILISISCINHLHSQQVDRLSSDVVNYIEAYIEKQMTKKMIPGLALGLIEGKQIVLAKGYGVKSVDTKDPVDENTLFNIGSCNKSFNGMLVACLVDKGILKWDSTVKDIRPDWQLKDSELGNVTVSQLLSMLSGIMADDEDDFFDEYGDNAVPADLFSFLSKLELEYYPDEKFSYSNISASLCGYLTVYATGGNTQSLNTGYSNVLQQYIFDPIGMNSSTIFISEAKAYGNLALPHEKHRKEVYVVKSEDRDDDPIAPSGSIKSSISDMCKYVSTQLQEGIAPDGTSVVTSANLTKTWEANPKTKREKYAMGWVDKKSRKIRVVSHEGSYDNYESVIVLLPEKSIGMVLLINTESHGNLLRKAPKLLIKALKKYKKLN